MKVKKEVLAVQIFAVIAVLAIMGLYHQAKNLEVRETEAKQIIESDKPILATPKVTETAVSIRYIGEFKITAYCSCSKCCGKWAKDRPKDKEGNEIVYTACGAIAQAGRTVAVDKDYIPYGTRLVIDGQEYIAQDTGTAVKDNCIDIYFNTHEEAVEYGCQKHDVYVIDY